MGFCWRSLKPPKRRLWRMKRGGFEEVSRFHANVAGNRLTDGVDFLSLLKESHPSETKEERAAGQFPQRDC